MGVDGMKTREELEAADRVCDLALDQIRELRKHVHTVFETLAQTEQPTKPSDELIVEPAVRASCQAIARITQIGKKLDGIVKDTPVLSAVKTERLLIRLASPDAGYALPAQQIQQRCIDATRAFDASVSTHFPSGTIESHQPAQTSSVDTSAPGESPDTRNDLLRLVLENCNPSIRATVCDVTHLSDCVSIQVRCEGVFRAFIFCRSGCDQAVSEEEFEVVRLVVYGDNEPELDQNPWKPSSHAVFQRLTELGSHIVERNKPPVCFSPLGSVLDWLATHKDMFSKSDNQPSKLMKLLY